MPAPEVLPSGPAWRVTAGLLLIAAAATAAPACAGPERSEPTVSDDLYVEVMSRLAAIRAASDPGRVADPLPPARADSLRRGVLARRGVSRADLKAFARLVGDEPDRMQALWKRIGARADSLTGAGWPVDTAATAADTAAGPDSTGSDTDTAEGTGGAP